MRNNSSSFLQTSKRSEVGFVGLENQGATCYLNALIQAFYMTPELRTGLYQINPKELGAVMLENLDSNAKKGRIEDETNADTSVNENQVLSNDADIDPRKSKKRPRYIPLELQRLFAKLQLLDQVAVSTQDLTMKGFQWTDADGSMQHDAHELIRLLIDALERSLKGTSGDALCRSLYQGTLVYQTRCVVCNTVSEREESFYDLNVQVLNCPDLTDSLSNYLSVEILDDDSAYACDRCKLKRPARRATVLRTLPTVLTFTCNRFKCDLSTNWSREKIFTKTAFPLLIDMRHFLRQTDTDTDGSHNYNNNYAALKSAPSTASAASVSIEAICAAAKVQAQRFVDRYGPTVSLEALSNADIREAGEALCAPHFFRKGRWNSREGDGIDSIARNGHGSGSAAARVRGGDEDLYQLQAVIIHKGSAFSGHYYAYIRDSLNEGSWSSPNIEASTSSKTAASQPLMLTLRASREGYEAGTVVVIEGSPLAKLICLFEALGERGIWTPATAGIASTGGEQRTASVSGRGRGRGRGRGGAGRLATRQPKDQLETSPSHPATASNVSEAQLHRTSLEDETSVSTPTSPPHVSIMATRLGRVIKQHMGGNWNDIYGSTFGALKPFLARHAALFTLVDKRYYLLHADKIVYVSDSVFEKLLNEERQSKDNDADATAAAATGMGIDSSPPVAVNIDSLSLTENDEALALALSMEDCDDVNNAASHAAAAADAVSTAQVGGAADASAWIGVGNRKQKKNNSGVIEAGGGVDEGAKGVGSEKDAESAASNHVIRFAEELMGYFHGRYFLFNDVSVKPMHLSDLCTAFEGKECAYLLMYRRLTFHTLKVNESGRGTVAELALMKSASTIPNNLQLMKKPVRGFYANLVNPKIAAVVDYFNVDYLPIPQPPELWVQEIRVANEVARLAREELDSKAFARFVKVYFPSALAYREPFLCPIIQPAASVPSSSSLVTANNEGGTEAMRCVLDVQIDSRKSIKDLLLDSRVQAQLSQLSLSLSAHTVVVCPLTSFATATTGGAPGIGVGFHPLSALNPDDSIQSVFSLINVTALMVWDGKSIDGFTVPTGPSHMPTRLLVTRLYRLCPPPSVISANREVKRELKAEGERQGEERHSEDIISAEDRLRGVGRESFELWTRSATTVLEACRRAISQVSLGSIAFTVYLVDVAHLSAAPTSATEAGRIVHSTRSLMSSSSSSLAASSSGSTYGRGYRLVPLLISSASMSEGSGSSGDENGIGHGVIFDSPEMTVLDLITPQHSFSPSTGDSDTDYFYGSELLLQPIDHEGEKQLPPLAQEEIRLRNFSIDLQIHVNLDAAKVISLAGAEVTAAELSSLAGLPEKVTVSVEKSVTVTTLRGLVIEKLQSAIGLGSTSWLTTAFTRLRTIALSEEGELVEGDRSLEDAGVTSTCELSLEFGRSYRPDALLLRVARYHYACDSAVAKTIGPEIVEIDIEPGATTLRQLKDRMGCALMGFAEGWSDPNEYAPVSISSSAAAVASPSASSPIGETLPHPGTLYRLRSTDWQDEPDDAICENNDDGSAVLVSSPDLNLQSGSLILLEEGYPPVAGSLDIRLYVWAPTSALSSDANKHTEENSSVSRNNSNFNHSDSDIEAAAALWACKQRAAMLVSIGSLRVSTGKTLRELHQHVYSLLTSGAVVTELRQRSPHWKGPSSPNSFLMRVLSSGDVPGLSLWVCDRPAAAIATNDQLLAGLAKPGLPSGGMGGLAASSVPSAVGQTAVLDSSSVHGATPLKSLQTLHRKLKRTWAKECSSVITSRVMQQLRAAAAESAHHTQASCLQTLLSADEDALPVVLEILDSEQSKKRPRVGGARIWAQRATFVPSPDGSHTSDVRSELKVNISPPWPPTAAALDGGVAPTLAHLRRAICTVLWNDADMSEKSTALFKFIPRTCTWMELLPGLKVVSKKVKIGVANAATVASAAASAPASSSKAIGVVVTKKAAQENILQAPYNIRDGDIICAVSLGAAGQDDMNPTGGSMRMNIDRPEDIYARLFSPNSRAMLKSAGVGDNKSSEAAVAAGPTLIQRRSRGAKVRLTETALSLGADCNFSDDGGDDNYNGCS